MSKFVGKVAAGFLFLGGGTSLAIGLAYVAYHLFIADHSVLSRILVGACALYMFTVGYKSVKEVHNPDES